MENEMQVMLNTVWAKTHKDYKTVMNGQKMVLQMVAGGGTGLVPVEVLTQKQLDAKVEATFYKFANGVQINIFNLGKVSDGIAAVLLAGGPDEAIQAVITKYAENVNA